MIVGANGTGKTNLYSALKLVQHAALGTLGSAIVGESVLAQIREPQRFPLGAEMAMRFAQLRFYHQFAVERASPIRSPQVAVRTGLLSDDGRDLAAAIATIDEIGDSDALHAAVDAAFPGAQTARELSDGTLRFLCLAVALTAPRPPLFLALNEPESSLHPDVLPALAERIAARAATTQILVTTRSSALADAIAARAGITPIRLVRERGETRSAEGGGAA